MVQKKVCVVTGSRAEYGLLYWLMWEIQNDPDLNLQVIVTGMHLSPEFGLTSKIIEENGFHIDKKIEMLLSSDTPVGISKSIGLGVFGFSEALEGLSPDILVIMGDRFEMLSAAIVAMNARIPIAHLHGGEATEGLIDEAIRHSLTKLSHLHFTATEQYRRRVIQLGEQPNRVYTVGGLGIDNIVRLKLMSKKETEEKIIFRFGKKNLLVTFHPVTLEKSSSFYQFSSLLKVLSELEDTHVIFTKPNADADGRIIIRMIDDFVANHSERTVAFVSMGQMNYLSTLRHIDAIVGNSSSALLEAPTFKIATVNIGDRQKGRIKAKSVFDCSPDYKSIKEAIGKVYSPEFQSRLPSVENPYGTGGASVMIKDIIKQTDLDGIIIKKFYDIDHKV